VIDKHTLDAASLVECAIRFAALADVYGDETRKLAHAHLSGSLSRTPANEVKVRAFLAAAVDLLALDEVQR
jgi:hypothetical protein